MEIRDRIIDFRRVRAGDLAPNPENYRTHSAQQKQALKQIISTIGIADAAIAYILPNGQLQLIDGHLRASLDPDVILPVQVLDVTEREAQVLLASLDPIAAMAKESEPALEKLLADAKQYSAEAAEAFALIYGVPTKERAEETITPKFAALTQFENEQQQFEFIAEMVRHGIDCKALSVGWSDPPPIDQSSAAPLAANQLRIVRESKIKRTPRVVQCEGMFDLPKQSKIRQEWLININLDRPWNIGLIVGPSGSGKTTLARELFAQELITGWDWPADAALIDGFPEAMPTSEITGLLSSVGFSSPPAWRKPFHVLSNGEQFRVNLARTLAEQPALAVVDEFTSVVDRTVAQIGSAALAKTIRHSNRRFVAVGCHYDVLEWLQPDWVYDTAAQQFQWRCLRRRPEIQLRIRRVEKECWSRFRQHHYLDHALNKSAHCYLGEVSIDGKPFTEACFTAVLSLCGNFGGRWREHRTVCLPDFQGVGIGNAMSEFIASMYVATGKRYNSTSSHPAMIRHRQRSPLWHCVREPSLADNASDTNRKNGTHKRATTRYTAGFEYVGPARPEQARAFGLKVA